MCLDSFVADLPSLFGLSGSLGLGTISLILPAAMALAQRDGPASRTLHRVGAIFTIILGLLVTFGSSGAIIKSIVSS